MKHTTALAAAGALVLMMAGGISTLAIIDRPAAVDPPVIIQYVDQAGNPVPTPGVTGAPEPQLAEAPPVLPEAALVTRQGSIPPSEEMYQSTVQQYQEDEHETYEKYEEYQEYDDDA